MILARFVTLSFATLKRAASYTMQLLFFSSSSARKSRTASLYLLAQTCLTNGEVLSHVPRSVRLAGTLGVEPIRVVLITCSPEHFTRCRFR